MSVRVISLVVEGMLLVMRYMELVSFDIVTVMLDIMMSVMSMIKLLMLPLIMDLANNKRVMVSCHVHSWIIGV